MLVVVGLVGEDSGYDRGGSIHKKHPPSLSCKFRGGELFKSCLVALEPHAERFLQIPHRYSANMMALVAALDGSGAVSCPMVDHMGGYPLRHANWVRYKRRP